MAACVYCEEPFRQGRCLCGLTKYGMRRRALREERAEMHVLWKFLEMADMDCMAEDFVVQELGPRTHDLYFASSLDVESDADSDPKPSSGMHWLGKGRWLRRWATSETYITCMLS